MPLQIDLEAVNSWRAKQKKAFESDPLPDIEESKTRRPFGERILYIVGATIFFSGPVVLIVLLRTILLELNLGQTGTWLVYFVTISITGTMWRLSWGSLKVGLGRTSSGYSLSKKAKHFLKRRDTSAVARCYLEILTNPWDKYAYPEELLSFLGQNKKEIKEDYFILFTELLFVEIWLTYIFRPQPEESPYTDDEEEEDRHRSLFYSKVFKNIAGSDRIIEFAAIVHEMGKDFFTEFERYPDILKELSSFLRINGALEAAQIVVPPSPKDIDPSKIEFRL